MFSTLEPYKGIKILEVAQLEPDQEWMMFAYLLRTELKQTRDGDWYVNVAFRDGYGKPIYGQLWNTDRKSETFQSIQTLLCMPVKVHFKTKKYGKSTRVSLDVIEVLPVAWEDATVLLDKYFTSSYAKQPAVEQNIIKLVSALPDVECRNYILNFMNGTNMKGIVCHDVLDGSIGGVTAILYSELSMIKTYFAVQPDLVDKSYLSRAVVCSILVELTLSVRKPQDSIDDDIWVTDCLYDILSRYKKTKEGSLLAAGLKDAACLVQSIFGVKGSKTFVSELCLMCREASLRSFELGTALSYYCEDSVVNVTGFGPVRK